MASATLLERFYLRRVSIQVESWQPFSNFDGRCATKDRPFSLREALLECSIERGRSRSRTIRRGEGQARPPTEPTAKDDRKIHWSIVGVSCLTAFASSIFPPPFLDALSFFVLEESTLGRLRAYRSCTIRSPLLPLFAPETPET